MPSWKSLLAEARDDYTFYLVAALVLTIIAVRATVAEGQRRLRWNTIFVLLHVALLPLVASLRESGSASYREVRIPCLVFAVLGAVGLLVTWIFSIVLPRARVRTPEILSDLVAGGISLVAIFVVASRAGLNLSSIIATSTVLTAVIGLSLQDTLGNLFGGLLLQLDDSVRVGDWVKVTNTPKIQPFGEIEGRVVEIHWRYTAVETRNWETLLVPNSQLVKGNVLVVGRAQGKPVQQRRWIWFNVDYRYPPNDVMRAVMQGLEGAVIPRVAADPPPNVVCMGIQETYAQYAVRYWLTDIGPNDPTDSDVRVRIYYALKRAGIPLGIPAQAVFLTHETPERKASKTRSDMDRRLRALERVELFGQLSAEDREQLAERLRYCPFARGEVIFREGTDADWLYMLVKGEVTVVVGYDGEPREVARIGAGQVFGEMSLMTGEKRSATLVAASDVECYLLDRAGFQEIIERRPEIAESVAEILARRRVERAQFNEQVDHEAERRRLDDAKSDLLGKIRDFFGLGKGRDGDQSGRMAAG